jgi:hypothetical protein
VHILITSTSKKKTKISNVVTNTVFHSLFRGFVASIPPLLGSILALLSSLPRSMIATIIAFGGGVLIAALAFSRIEEAFS